VLETLLALRCRRHLSRLDQSHAARSQLRALLSLVHRARGTRFGRDHDFERVRTAADFRRLVPLRGPDELARDYGRRDAAWPAARRGDLQSVQRQAVGTALALALRERLGMRLLDGTALWLGDEPVALEVARARFPTELRYAVRTSAADEPASLLVGPPEAVEACLRRSNIRSTLELAITLRSGPESSRQVPERVGDRGMVIEMLCRPEAPLAVADPRRGGMRLLVDHGVYFEFVPADRSGQPHPPRLGLDEVRPGAAYELALTAPGGVWAQRTGLVVAFERLEPPAVRLLASGPAGERLPILRSDGPAPPPPAPHRRSAGSPAAPPETFFHSLLSARADRG
jgi:hypothetical protein